MKTAIPKFMWYIGGVIVSGLISVNAYFVKGLVDTIKETNDKVVELDKKLAVIDNKVENLGFRIRGLHNLQKESCEFSKQEKTYE